MLIKLATGVFVTCLAGWCLLSLLLGMTLVKQGASGLGPKLLHLAGNTKQLGIQSWSLVIWRLLGLLAITLIAGYFSRDKKVMPKST